MLSRLFNISIMDHIIYERPDRLNGLGINQEHFFIATKKASIKDRICLSPIVKYVVPACGLVALLMTAVYLTMYYVLEKSNNVEWPATCNIRSSYRVECFPGRNETTKITYDDCIDVGCCWHDETEICFHSIPSRHGYTPKNSGPYEENGILVPRKPTSPLGSKNADSVSFELRNVDPNHVEIIMRIIQSDSLERINVQTEKLFDERPPGKHDGLPSFSGEHGVDELSKKLLYFLPDNPRRRTVNFQDDVNSNMDVYFHSPEFSVTVSRNNDPLSQHPLLSTARGPLILTKSFWELTLYITNGTLYGLNGLQLNGTTNFIYSNENGTARPAFLGIDDNGQATSCYINYNGPMEIQVLDESNLVVLRGLSLPEEISFHVFAGPTPLEAVRQLTQVLQLNFPIDGAPVASLGLHVCPNDDSIEFIEILKASIENMEKNKAPWDSHCLHQTFNPTLGKPLSESQKKIFEEALVLLSNNEGTESRILAPHLSPMLFNIDNPLATQLANSSLLLINSSGPYEGLYYKQSVVYPDWFDKRTSEESHSSFTSYLNELAASKLLYLRDSWPKDEKIGSPALTNSEFDYAPRGLKERMSTGTVPYNLLSSSRTNFHYVEHNAYSERFRNSSTSAGWSSLTVHGLPGNSGKSSWAALRETIRVGVGSALVGQLPPPMYICGTGTDFGPGENSDELCSRWYGAAVVWPHVLVIAANLPGGDHLTQSASNYAARHLKLRGSLLTYTRTILAEHHARGSPLLAPTSIYYPEDLWTRNRWNQFLWGDSILVGLVTLPGVSQVSMWLPGKYPWRHLHGGLEFHPSNSSATSISATEGQIVTLVRPGHIVPLHENVSMTSTETLKNPLTLAINLACDVECVASGKIFYGENDDEFLYITATDTTLHLENVLIACESSASTNQTTMIQYVEILGTPTYDISTDFCSLGEDLLSIIFKES